MLEFEGLEWKLQGNCSGKDTERFFDSSVQPSDCSDCPVWNNCIIYAVEHNENGWWAGHWFEYKDSEGPDWVEEFRLGR